MDAGNVDVWDLIDSSLKSDSQSSSSPSWTGSNSPGIGSDTNCSDGISSNATSNQVENDFDGLILPDDVSLLDIAVSNSTEFEQEENTNDDCLPQKPKKSKASKNDKDLNAKQSLQLPCCRVCGGTSSGCHFGVITCESCKVFYRRSLTRNTTYFCGHGENCVIKPGKRSNCSFCRLKKCVQLGMSKDGVKKGRYTIERKQDYRVMVEMIETEEKEKKDQEEKEKEMHQKMIKDTIERLKYLHHKHIVVTTEVLDRVRQGELRRKEYKKALEEAMGPTPPISPQEALEFLKETGIDITGYRDVAKTCAKSCPDFYSIAFVSYVKDLHEYMDLPLADRIVVLKGAIQVWLLISTLEVPNTIDFTVSCISCGICMSEEHFMMFGSSEKFRACFRPVQKLQELNLTDDEKAVLRAFVIFDTSQCVEDLIEPAKVDTYQNLFLECLLHVLEEVRGKENAAKIFSTIIQVLTDSRSILEEKKEMIFQALEILRDVKYSRITAEIYGLPEFVVDDLGEGLDNLQL